MAINSACKDKVMTCNKNTSLEEVSRMMSKYHVGSLVVVDDFYGKKIPAGIITDRDLALSIGASLKPGETKVDQIMQSQPITVNENDGIFDTILKMKENGIRRIPVTRNDGSLCGIVSSEDLLRLVGEEINNLANISEIQIKNENGIRVPIKKHITDL